ncbi:hypothetical protein [Methylobacterium sp. GC_Met_2]|uniref:hypothetical protein n=1 Tax=Methylobacterium sp. GC_Met_2 TaxID=2937376 RepID=UPI00226B0AA0|nr:hypothetical protein [Methylobacterium sp. GC_Met_2]
MARGQRYTPRPAKPKKPTTALAAAPHVGAFLLKRYDRQDGEAADWPLIAETLFREAFAALDLTAADPRTAPLALSITRRIHAGAYDRLKATPDDAFKDAPAHARSTPSVDYEGPQYHPVDRPDAPLVK